MAIQKSEVIILRTQPLRSSSLIVTFYSRAFGKLKGVAKGVREERQIRSAVFELFNQLEIVFYEKTRSDLHLISDTFLLDSYPRLRTKIESIAYASYFCDLVDQLCEIHDPHEEVFDLLNFSFQYLPSIPGERLARLFEIKLLNEIGWLPYLDQCLSCYEQGLKEGFFSARQGALFCEKCAHKFPDARPMSQEVLSVMRYYSSHATQDSIRLGMSRATEEELQKLLDRFLMDRLTKRLKSQKFLDILETFDKSPLQTTPK